MRANGWGLAVLVCACESGGDFYKPHGPGEAALDGASISTGETGGELIDDRPVEHAEVAPPPITGGTLAITDDGTIVAADPDRDRIHLASAAAGSMIASIELEPGDEPGRIALDDDGLAHVVLRGAGAIASIDMANAHVLARHATCANPRGVAWDAASARVLVACAGGELVSHRPAEGIDTRIRVAPDLRDVFVHDGVVSVTRFRSAEVLTLAEGRVQDVLRPPSLGRPAIATTAWRTTAALAGGWLMVHHSSSTTPIDLSPEGSQPYGDGGGDDDGGGPADCSGPVTAEVTLRARPDDIPVSARVSFATLPVDAVLSPDGRRIAVAVAGQSDPGSPTMAVQRSVGILEADSLAPEPDVDCTDPPDLALSGQITAVAFVDDDTLVAQSREPAALHVVTLADLDVRTIELPGGSRRDTGHERFHQDAGVGLACASCHPEGTDDGKVWTFLPGPMERRTQPLRAALAGTEPFHWEGDLADFFALVGEVQGRRMGGAFQTEERDIAFRDWLFAMRVDNPERTADDPLVQSGRAVFTSRGCAGCHDDALLAEGRAAEIASHLLQVPLLDGIALRPPYMHDGRAPDLQAAVLDMMATTPAGAPLSDAELTAMVAYLESL